MKLSKEEAGAIALKVQKSRIAEAKKHNLALYKDKKVSAEAQRIYKAIKSLPKDISKHLEYPPTLDRIKKRLVQPKMMSDYPDLKSIESDIIIACIDVSTLDELKKKLKVSF